MTTRKGKPITDDTQYYKLARPDGWDFYTGRTINYRQAIGQLVAPPHPDAALGLCSKGVLHASQRAEDCFQGARIPCSLYVVKGASIVKDQTKAGFLSLRVVSELDPATHFKWRYALAVEPLHPLQLPFRASPSQNDQALLKQWASVWASVWVSVWDSVGASVRDSVGASVRDSMGANVWASVRDSVRASVWASVWAYIGWIFAPVVPGWKGEKARRGAYPFMASVQLWKRGLMPSWDGLLWRLHSGPHAEIVWEGTP